MNKNFILTISLLCLFFIDNTYTQQTQQIKSKIQAAKTSGKLPTQPQKPTSTKQAPAQNQQPAHKQPSTQKPTSSSSQNPSQELDKDIQSLIEKFTQAVDKIPAKPQDGNLKDYKDGVEKAYKAYEELFNHNKEHKSLITSDQNSQVKKAAIKLFNAKNIKNMVWHARVQQPQKSDTTKK